MFPVYLCERHTVIRFLKIIQLKLSESKTKLKKKYILQNKSIRVRPRVLSTTVVLFLWGFQKRRRVVLNQSIIDKNQLIYNLAYVQKWFGTNGSEGLSKIYRVGCTQEKLNGRLRVDVNIFSYTSF